MHTNMWLGNGLGRLWAWKFGGTHVGCACDDPRVQVWLVKRLVPGWAAGQAWGNVILVHESCWNRRSTDDLLIHEYRHVLQWRRYRSAFVLLYLAGWMWAFMRHGPRQAYWMNWMEREARGEP